jgi:hypothetical protein
MATSIKTDSAVLAIPTEFIVPNPNQPRRSFDLALIEELADDINSNGQNTPGAVVKVTTVEQARDLLDRLQMRVDQDNESGVGADMLFVRSIATVSAALDGLGDRATKLATPLYMLVYGERRFRACLLGKLPTYRAEVRTGLSDRDVQTMAFIENVSRKDMTFAEEAHGLLRWMTAYGLEPFSDDEETRSTAIKAATKGDKALGVPSLGKSVLWVTGRLDLFRVHAHVRQVFETTSCISPYCLSLMSRLDDDKQIKMLALMESGKVSTGTQFTAALTAMQQREAMSVGQQQDLLDTALFHSDAPELRRLADAVVNAVAALHKFAEGRSLVGVSSSDSHVIGEVLYGARQGIYDFRANHLEVAAQAAQLEE